MTAIEAMRAKVDAMTREVEEALGRMFEEPDPDPRFVCWRPSDGPPPIPLVPRETP